MRYIGGERFSLAYRRHNDQWCEVYDGLTVEEALKTIRDEELFWPVL